MYISHRESFKLIENLLYAFRIRGTYAQEFAAECAYRALKIRDQ